VASDNAAVARRVYELFNTLEPDPEARRGSPAMRELMGLFHEDLEYVQMGGLPDAGSFGDRRSFAEIWDEWLSVWREHRSTIEEVRTKGDRVLVLSHERLRPREGMEFENRGAGIFTIRDGRIVRLEAYMDQQPAIDAFERS
jgi:ketosteroid isomerase-like protein